MSGVQEASSKDKTRGKKIRNNPNVATYVISLLRTTGELELKLSQTPNEAEIRYGMSKWDGSDQLQSSCSAIKMLLVEKQELNC